MERAILLEHLAQADRHVAAGERIIARQRELVAIADRDGADAREAIALLRTFEETQAIYLADQARLREELEGGW